MTEESLNAEDMRRLNDFLSYERYKLRRDADAGFWRARRFVAPTVSILELIAEHEEEQARGQNPTLCQHS